ncbi:MULTISPECIES: winged helix-turn-helix domain-containing protein [Haloferax]|uniref:ArsR family transcriptional regulator n=1 Tax=Haloferax marinum TaxID=2666143 RepID=A0A6A8GBR3_9EURY|nr:MULTISPECIES: winged helix-turn-helix domain-containing protein [Haloferax]KAB1191221.1 winged helix-turn-helix transcriptional regulator [Haloferax sp. CBA1150]MRW98112.1 ArsR family transcriptional regulator [Haloferax marinum]
MSSVSAYADDVRWDDIGFVISSRYRVDVIERLDDGPATPTQIASDSKCPVAHVSRAIQELRDRSIVELLVPEDRTKGRVYGITDDAEGLWKVIEGQQMA